MKAFFSAPLILTLCAVIGVPRLSAAQDHAVPAAASLWQSTSATHVYGFPDMKPNKAGTLVLSADALTFTGKAGSTSIPRSSVTAVSAGNQRMELWGTKGRILRMAIPDGGGLAAATFLHHRVDILTVEFRDARGGKHGAVFFLPASEADRALERFGETPEAARESSDRTCGDKPVALKSVLVSTPNWDGTAVPAAYRALVYEHVVDRLRKTKDVGHVYRDGEEKGQDGCPQYTVHISIEGFKPGSSVQRAYLGPVGMFVGTTQMTFDTTLTDASGKLEVQDEVKATMRGESESTDVADKVAKGVAKHYSAALKNAEKSGTTKSPDAGKPYGTENSLH
jgi:hypothetical protein